MRGKLPNDVVERWDSIQRDPANWLPVKSSDFPVRKKARFQERKKGLMLYLDSDLSIDEIVLRSSVSRSELYRVLERAFQARPDGLPVGFLACIPGYRLKSYTRTSKSPLQRAGRMSQFLALHPVLHKKLDDWALGRVTLEHSVIRGRHIKQLWLAFRDVCKEAGLDVENDYPFTNRDGGREAVRRYVVQLRNRNFVAQSRVVHGDAVGRLAQANGCKLPLPTYVPYARVQFDGHRIDGVFTVRQRDPQGNDLYLPLSRIWLLVLIDMASRAVLGYHLSLSENYTSDDVLACIGTSLEPWKPREIPAPIKGYLPGDGLPSGVIDQCAWRIFDTLQMDNAYSHLSARVQSRILDCGALEVITNRPHTPRADSIVERFNETFEMLLHQWPNTTGSSPKDPRRRNPDAAASRLQLEFAQLQVIADLTIAQYNGTVHESLNGRSPLDYLRYRLERGTDLVRYAPSRTIDGLALYERESSVTIRAGAVYGHRPYIQFHGARYSSEWLKERADLKGIAATFRFNSRDIRTGHIFLASGQCLGQVEADRRWQEHSHSLAMRRDIAALVKAGKLQRESHRPVTDYLKYLAKQAPLSRRARNALLKNERDTSVSKDSTSVEPITNSTNTRRRREWISLDTTYLK